MRTTIYIDDALLAEAKQVAARTGRSLTAVVEDALRESLHRRPTPPTELSSCPYSARVAWSPGWTWMTAPPCST